MDKIEKVIQMLVYTYISIIFRKKDVYVITGMRRSGNHAFINWFLCAIENEKTDFSPLDVIGRDVLVSSSDKTIFFNEVNFRGIRKFVNTITAVKSNINNASFVIISMEDYTPSKISPYIPFGAKRISITRSVLNLISSRLRRAQNQAALGLDRGDMRIDDRFICGVEWILNSSNYGWQLWNYDSWVKDDNEYKEKFLSNFQLKFNYTHAISKQGDGSSFSFGTDIPSYTDATTRWTQIKLPERIIELLMKSTNETILTQDEKIIIESLLNKTHLSLNKTEFPR